MRLFLDIDGVLNTHNQHPNGCGRINPEPVRLLNGILKTLPDLKIVLSSAWRYSVKNDPEIAQWLLMSHGVDCFKKIEGCTRPDSETWIPFHPWTNEKWSDYGIPERSRQILDYNAAGPCKAWVVLDDLDLRLGSPSIPEANFVKTEPHIGLTDFEVGDVIAKLLKQAQ